MSHKILETKCLFENRWLRLFQREVDSNGKKHSWIFASRQMVPEMADKGPDAVVIVAMTPDEKVVVTREYRVPLGDYEVGFPAGLIEEDQTPEEAAIREMKEETGLDLKVIHVGKNLFSSAGLTNESAVYVFGYASGEVSSEFLQDSEDIQVALLDNFHFLDAESARAWPMFRMFEMMGIKKVFEFFEERCE